MGKIEITKRKTYFKISIEGERRKAKKSSKKKKQFIEAAEPLQGA